MTTVSGEVQAYHAGSTSLSFTVAHEPYGVPLDNSAFAPPPAVAVTNFSSGVVQAIAVISAYTTGAEISFEVDVGTNQTLHIRPPGSEVSQDMRRAFNVQQRAA